MFTVKHISLTGSEEIHQSNACRFTPERHQLTSDQPPNSPATVWIDTGPLTGGTVFVMNDAGKTVSRYDLGGSMVPYSKTDGTASGLSVGVYGSEAKQASIRA
jgi:hypothetical protein